MVVMEKPAVGAPVAQPDIVLYQPSPALGVRQPGPFCLRVETWFRLAGLSYRVKAVNNPGKGPKGKVPWVKLDGIVLGDSELIIDQLTDRLGLQIGPVRTEQQRAQDLALTRLLSDHFYFIMVYSRWVDPRGWSVVGDVFFKPVPVPLRGFVRSMVRKQVLKQLHMQGMGRHSADEIYRMGTEDLDAMDTILGDNPFFAGNAPGPVDALAYGFLANLVQPTLDTPLNQDARSRPWLVDYVARMTDRVYPDIG